MSNPWPIVRMGEVLRHRKEFVTIDDLATYKRPRVQLHAQGIVQRDEVGGALIKTKTQQVCRAGEFLVAEIDAKVGGYGIVPEALAGAIVSSHYFLFVVEESKLNHRFLDFFTRTPAFREQVEAQGSTNYAAIRPTQVLDYKIPLPPLSEQRRVVARIEQLTARIDEARVLRHQSTEEADALIASKAKQVLMQAKLKFGEVPLLQVCDFEGGSQPSKSMFRYEATPGYVRFLQIRDFSSDDHVTFIPDSPRNSMVEPDEVLVGRYGASLGKILRGKTGAYNVAMCKAVPKRAGLHSDFLAFSLAHGAFQERLSEISRSAQAGFNKSDLRDTKLTLPPISEQRRIVKEMDALQAEVDRLKRLQEETSKELDAMLPSILDMAFKGEL